MITCPVIFNDGLPPHKVNLSHKLLDHFTFDNRYNVLLVYIRPIGQGEGQSRAGQGDSGAMPPRPQGDPLQRGAGAEQGYQSRAGQGEGYHRTRSSLCGRTHRVRCSTDGAHDESRAGQEEHEMMFSVHKYMNEDELLVEVPIETASLYYEGQVRIREVPCLEIPYTINHLTFDVSMVVTPCNGSSRCVNMPKFHTILKRNYQDLMDRLSHIISKNYTIIFIGDVITIEDQLCILNKHLQTYTFTVTKIRHSSSVMDTNDTNNSELLSTPYGAEMNVGIFHHVKELNYDLNFDESILSFEEGVNFYSSTLGPSTSSSPFSS